MKDKFNGVLSRGFTLIELLVVIAIIGILAAVVLASLNDARDSGQDASLKQSLGNLRSQAELVYNEDGFSYENVCSDSRITPLLEAAIEQRAETTGTPQIDLSDESSDTSVTCHSDASGYAVIAPVNVPVGSNDAWCVDSTGFAGAVEADALAANDVACE